VETADPLDPENLARPVVALEPVPIITTDLVPGGEQVSGFGGFGFKGHEYGY
jgi:hypothetical protein